MGQGIRIFAAIAGPPVLTVPVELAEDEVSDPAHRNRVGWNRSAAWATTLSLEVFCKFHQ
jgi:hypothetical protein